MAMVDDDSEGERPTFEWDSAKAQANAKKHGVTFDEPETIFADPRSLDVFDPDHSATEDRFVKIGTSTLNRLLVAVYTERSMRIRIISARRANRLERADYEVEH